MVSWSDRPDTAPDPARFSTSRTTFVEGVVEGGGGSFSVLQSAVSLYKKKARLQCGHWAVDWSWEVHCCGRFYVLVFQRRKREKYCRARYNISYEEQTVSSGIKFDHKAESTYQNWVKAKGHISNFLSSIPQFFLSIHWSWSYAIQAHSFKSTYLGLLSNSRSKNYEQTLAKRFRNTFGR